jgi:hypothetical protein
MKSGGRDRGVEVRAGADTSTPPSLVQRDLINHSHLLYTLIHLLSDDDFAINAL